VAKRGPKNKYDPLELTEQLYKYIDETDDPQLAEFCLPRTMPVESTIYRLAETCSELSEAIKRLVKKQEIYLSRCGNGNMHPTICVFRLKQPQHGYTDKQQIDANVSGTLEINVNITEE
jgi:hypothetical protein